ncbi:centromere protein H [Paramormyrops kingsleyae]|uniref:Centromere protein H n=1 Tax=Paramormyrops kingsleyae TaxID=1676925 RepID=A0A3B3Q206_9TELE|nr:centromere protein H [Paramormyrops kingsleyae]
MDLFDELENVASRLETVALSGCQAPEDPNGKDNSPAQILRIKEKMANQCFEMQVKISAEKLKKSCGEQESSRDMSECESEIEEARINHCNKTLALQRMQIWWGISERLKKNDTESEVLKASAKHSLELSSKILEVQQESSEIQDQVFQLQKKRLDLKRLIHEKMKEMEELKRMREHPEEGKYKKALEKGQEYLQKYQKMATMTQNVLQGTILASKVNWRDDPKLKDIALELEDIQLY